MGSGPLAPSAFRSLTGPPGAEGQGFLSEPSGNGDLVRDYAVVSPRFWTGETGREIRKCGKDARLVAMYLLTAPGSNMIGLYYLPLPILCHETDLPLEGASEALARLARIGFAHYDKESEMVWVPEMARFQIGPEVTPRDNRWKGIRKELEALKKSSFYAAFLEHYGSAYCLTDKPLESPSEPASNPLLSQEQDQEQEQKQDQERELGAEKRKPRKRSVKQSEPPPPLPASLSGVEGLKELIEEFGAYRAKIQKAKTPMTSRAWTIFMNKLTDIGPQWAVVAIKWAMAKDWREIFEPDPTRKDSWETRAHLLGMGGNGKNGSGKIDIPGLRHDTDHTLGELRRKGKLDAGRYDSLLTKSHAAKTPEEFQAVLREAEA